MRMMMMSLIKSHWKYEFTTLLQNKKP